jgi:predicted O-methyltransferase YrrM
MRQEPWTAVDGYIVDRLVRPDAALAAALAANEAAGLPAHDVSPAQGKLLHLLARMIGGRRILEIGTLGGYSTIWLARALRLARRGTILIGDNVVRDGAVLDRDSDDPRVQGVRRFFDLLAEEPRVSATVLQTVGSKGWDGFVLAIVD